MSALDPEAASNRGNTLVPIGIAAILAIAIVALLSLPGGDPIERSAIGLRGLMTWLEHEGVATTPVVADPGPGGSAAMLRLLPLYDPDLSMDTEASETLDADHPRETLRNLPMPAFADKIRAADTLVVLPKWRSDMVTSGVAHPGVLISPRRMTIFGDRREPVVERADPGFVEASLIDARTQRPLDGTAAFYAPQVLAPTFDEICKPLVILAGQGTLLARCRNLPRQGDSFILLSDPDLVDNHGLANGDNASLAAATIRNLARGRPVYLDTTTRAAMRDVQGLDPRERSLSDLVRFVAYPFSLFWVGVLILAGLALWRGSRRFGAPIPELFAHEAASKARTIAASSRLLRLAGSEENLFGAYIHARMDTLCAAVLGPSHGATTRSEIAARILTRTKRRDPEAGHRLAAAYDRIVDSNLSERQRLAALVPFENAVQETLDAFGCASHPTRPDHG